MCTTNAQPGSITYSTARPMTSKPTYTMCSHGLTLRSEVAPGRDPRCPILIQMRTPGNWRRSWVILRSGCRPANMLSSVRSRTPASGRAAPPSAWHTEPSATLPAPALPPASAPARCPRDDAQATRSPSTRPTRRSNPKPGPQKENPSSNPSGHPHSCRKTHFEPEHERRALNGSANTAARNREAKHPRRGLSE